MVMHLMYNVTNEKKVQTHGVCRRRYIPQRPGNKRRFHLDHAHPAWTERRHLYPGGNVLKSILLPIPVHLSVSSLVHRFLRLDFISAARRSQAWELSSLLTISCERIFRLVVSAGLAVVSDNLEAANHLTDGEESDALGSNDTAGNKLSIAEVAGLLEHVLGRLEEGAVLEGSPESLVGVLEGGDGTIATILR